MEKKRRHLNINYRDRKIWQQINFKKELPESFKEKLSEAKSYLLKDDVLKISSAMEIVEAPKNAIIIFLLIENDKNLLIFGSHVDCL